MNFKRMKLKKSLIIGFAMAMVPLVLIIVFCLLIREVCRISSTA